MSGTTIIAQISIPLRPFGQYVKLYNIISNIPRLSDLTIKCLHRVNRIYDEIFLENIS